MGDSHHHQTPPSGIELRDALPEHLERVTQLNEAAVPAVNSVEGVFFRHYAGMGERKPLHSPYFRVAVDGKAQVMGFLLALLPGEAYDSINYRWFNERYDDFLYVDRIVVAPEAQGRGLGRLFYRDLIALVEELGPRFARIACEVNLRPRNEQSLNFHQRFGFRQQGTQENDGGKKVVSLMTYCFGAG